MNQARYEVSCTLFNGRIVASGGDIPGSEMFKSVEAYDHTDDSWSYLPNMIKARCRHRSVAVKNKLFILGGETPLQIFETTCEVFDSFSNNFTLLKSPLPFSPFHIEVIPIGSKLFVFAENQILKTSVLIYDLESECWSEESCEMIEDLAEFFCVKVPKTS